MAYQYNQVEAALAHAFGIQPEAIKAFRARLQYLRAQGVPSVEAPGKGRRVEFKRIHVTQMLVALELQAIGFAPAEVPEIVKRSVESTNQAAWYDATWGDPKWDMWLLVEPNFLASEAPSIQVDFRDAILAYAQVKREQNRRHTLTNITHRARLVWTVLDDVKPAPRGP